MLTNPLSVAVIVQFILTVELGGIVISAVSGVTVVSPCPPTAIRLATLEVVGFERTALIEPGSPLPSTEGHRNWLNLGAGASGNESPG